MAAAFCTHLAGGRARGESAGTAPGPAVHPVVVTAMREKGIELAGIVPRLLTADLAAGADVLVTMGCGETCPVAPGVQRIDWPLEDPKDQPLERVRLIRDDIEARTRALLVSLDANLR